MIATQHYGMFTDAGNSAVDSIVEMARKHQLSWPTVRAMLSALAQDERFEEATDTAVREAVYETLVGNQNPVDQ
jgi:acetone carboxylase gamma subunit